MKPIIAFIKKDWRPILFGATLGITTSIVGFNLLNWRFYAIIIPMIIVHEITSHKQIKQL